MSLFDINFDEVKVEKTFEAIPAGTYNVISDDAELKETKDGTGSYVLVKFKIINGEQEGRFLFANFNITNKNEQASKIGIQQLKQFMECSGVKEKKLVSPTQLVGYKAQAVVKHKTDSYGTKAVVSYYKPLSKDSLTNATASGKGADGLW